MNDWDLVVDEAQRLALVPDDLPEEEVQRLNGRGALVQ